ncbi:uncharacterized protein BDR25DRAFT_365533 [Lindgomyces ingoldianus]|uniref:Uncharacterized protein n=1 Tax=Lindgomyces ingoldianus TaxID=673940 RepID=A0ACB6RIP9_9PLEO|nr:uncharacterized protein BDR25DRAFT_365533 [Lindgomyces ingoldianus]KAF2478341.1 hypothetical protein BDR25DRAFT_365533 [Lindgomyces ingoldianus]
MLSNLLLLPKSLLFCLLFPSICSVLADTPPYLNDQKFENGEYGPYPVQTFHSSKMVAPRLNILSTHSRCDDGSYTMFNPRGFAVPEEGRGPMILDAEGNVVWAATGYEQTYNLMAQEYRGKQYLTFWSGNDAIGGHGNGQYIMLDSSYKEVARMKAANGLEADLHEFRFTDAGTALITIYDVQVVDLTPLGGSPKGHIWDSVFQELDILTGKLVFQWRASEHFSPTDSYHNLGTQGGSGNPWDFFHINSVEKDLQGNYLISSRYTSTISYISGETGEVLWILGGRRNNFTDLSDGRATDFTFQHDARWHDNYTTISLFNNGAQAPGRKENAHFSRAMRVRIDTHAMSARLDTQYTNPLEISSSSQGNMQVLPNGNVLVGYGYNSAFTEFAPNGVVLCETHFGAASRFHTGDVQSYRVMKFNWTGTPDTDPEMAIVDGSAYVSWNGATKVYQWILETGDKRAWTGYQDEIRWQVSSKIDKSGFETRIRLPQDRGSYIRVVAVDKAGKSLGLTKAVKLEKVRTLPTLS